MTEVIPKPYDMITGRPFKINELPHALISIIANYASYYRHVGLTSWSPQLRPPQRIYCADFKKNMVFNSQLRNLARIVIATKSAEEYRLVRNIPETKTTYAHKHTLNSQCIGNGICLITTIDREPKKTIGTIDVFGVYLTTPEINGGNYIMCLGHTLHGNPYPDLIRFLL